MQHAYGVGTLPPGWSMAIDASGRTYYQNDYTHETQWEPPGALQAQMVSQGSLLQPEYVFCGIQVSQATHFRLCILLLVLNVGVILRNSPPSQCEPDECDEWSTWEKTFFSLGIIVVCLNLYEISKHILKYRSRNRHSYEREAPSESSSYEMPERVIQTAQARPAPTAPPHAVSVQDQPPRGVLVGDARAS